MDFEWKDLFKSDEDNNIDLWEYETTPCERCLMVFPNRYYYMTHYKSHLSVSLSRNEIYNYLIQHSMPIPQSLMKQETKIEKEVQNICKEILQTMIECKIEMVEEPETLEVEKKSICNKKLNVASPQYILHQAPPKKYVKTYSTKTPKVEKELTEINDDTIFQDCKISEPRDKHGSSLIYECMSCFLDFTMKFDYISHIGRFECKRAPFTCGLCEDQFAKKSRLIKHIENVHKGKSHDCDICKKTFVRPHLLKRHMRYKHRGSHLKSKSINKNLNKGKKINSKETNAKKILQNDSKVTDNVNLNVLEGNISDDSSKCEEVTLTQKEKHESLRIVEIKQEVEPDIGDCELMYPDVQIKEELEDHFM